MRDSEMASHRTQNVASHSCKHLSLLTGFATLPPPTSSTQNPSPPLLIITNGPLKYWSVTPLITSHDAGYRLIMSNKQTSFVKIVLSM